MQDNEIFGPDSRPFSLFLAIPSSRIFHFEIDALQFIYDFLFSSLPPQSAFQFCALWSFFYTRFDVAEYINKSFIPRPLLALNAAIDNA